MSFFFWFIWKRDEERRSSWGTHKFQNEQKHQLEGSLNRSTAGSYFSSVVIHSIENGYSMMIVVALELMMVTVLTRFPVLWHSGVPWSNNCDGIEHPRRREDLQETVKTKQWVWRSPVIQWRSTERFGIDLPETAEPGAETVVSLFQNFTDLSRTICLLTMGFFSLKTWAGN